MVAKIIRQAPYIKEEFRKRIQAKVAMEKEDMKKSIDEELPSLLAWITKPIFGTAFDIKRNKQNKTGEQGETDVAFKLRLSLSNQWTIMNDIVLELEPEVFAQIDHIVVGPPGVIVIETKAWTGAYIGFNDQ
ncbi:MAG: nuclease-related domain-containing protein [Dehalobacterium sp.]